MSFVYPILIATAMDWGLLRLVMGPIPNHGDSTLEVLQKTWKNTLWISLAALAGIVTVHGDYLVVGALVSKVVLGVYFFSYQLAASVHEMFVAGFRSVLMPSLSSVSNENGIQSRAYLKAVRLMMLLASPICVVGALMTPWLVEICWSGKWESATQAIQILLVAVAMRLLMPLGIAGLEAQGRWRLAALLMWLDAVGVVLAASIGAYFGTTLAIALAISSNQLLMGLTTCVSVTWKTPRSTHRILAKAMSPFLMAVLLGCIVEYIRSNSLGTDKEFKGAALSTLLFAVLFASAAWLWFKETSKELLRTLGASRR